MSAPILQLDAVTIRFGGLTAVSELSLSIGGDELVGLIGPNGAGKTTAFNLITGVYQPTSGSIQFGTQATGGLKPHQLTKLGIARTFQNIRLFASLSVFDNVRAAVQLHRPHGIINALWRGRSFRDGEAEVEKQVLELLDVFNPAASATAMRRACPTVTSDGSKSSAPSRPSPNSYCSTNPPPA